jgi:hypothetical protein
MKHALILLIFVTALGARADEICIKQWDIPLPTVPVQLRECRYLVSEVIAAKTLAFAPPSDVDHLSSVKALKIAYEAYFAKHGISKSEFYQIAELRLERIDDYTRSSVAGEIHRRKSGVAGIWFYVVKCGDPQYGESKFPPAPIVILLDGTIIEAKERLKPLPGLGMTPIQPLQTTTESGAPGRV